MTAQPDIKLMLDLLRANGNFTAVVGAITEEFNRQFPNRIEASRPNIRSTRDTRIARMYRSGDSVDMIAVKLGLSSRQVRNILGK